MPKLTELPDGTWLDLTKVTSIRPREGYGYVDELTPPHVYVGVGDADCFVTLEFETVQTARDYAAELARMVNQAIAVETP